MNNIFVFTNLSPHCVDQIDASFLSSLCTVNSLHFFFTENSSLFLLVMTPKHTFWVRKPKLLWTDEEKELVITTYAFITTSNTFSHYAESCSFKILYIEMSLALMDSSYPQQSKCPE